MERAGMTGIEMLLAEFDEPLASAELQTQFKDLAFVLKDLRMPLNLQALRALLDARRITARAA